MSTQSSIPTVIHILHALNVPDNKGGTRVAERGEVVQLNQKQIEFTRDREGNSWLQMSDDEQRERWGFVSFRPGLIPEGESINVWDEDEGLRNLLRDRALLEASKLGTEQERLAAKQAAIEKFGRAQTSQSLGYIPEGKW